MRRKTWSIMRKLGRATATAGVRWIDERCPTMAAAVAFFAAFSLAPTLVIVIAIGGAFFGPEAVRGQLVGQLTGLIGEEGALAVQGLIQSAWLAEGSLLKTLLSVATLLIGASAVFAELSEDVNLLWKVPPRPGDGAVSAFLRVRLLSIGLVVGVGFLLVVSLVLDTVVTALQDLMWPPDDAVRLLMGVVNEASSLLLLGGTFALLMKAMPRARVQWQEVTLGASVAAVLFVVGKSLFGLYLARAGTVDAFGAAGSLAVLLMWLFYSAAVFLYGVAFARAWSEQNVPSLPETPATAAAAGPDMR
ncbi:MAG: YihY/virulence factor BrkB family protein [Burkholderiales bacterium]|nr:MAG: YihY/virulence factor BrkB family protein [Burkholderiales bacterium]